MRSSDKKRSGGFKSPGPHLKTRAGSSMDEPGLTGTLSREGITRVVECAGSNPAWPIMECERCGKELRNDHQDAETYHGEIFCLNCHSFLTEEND